MNCSRSFNTTDLGQLVNNTALLPSLLNETELLQHLQHTGCHRENSLLFLLLMLGTVWLAVSLYNFNKTPYLQVSVAGGGGFVANRLAQIAFWHLVSRPSFPSAVRRTNRKKHPQRLTCCLASWLAGPLAGWRPTQRIARDRLTLIRWLRCLLTVDHAALR